MSATPYIQELAVSHDVPPPGSTTPAPWQGDPRRPANRELRRTGLGGRGRGQSRERRLGAGQSAPGPTRGSVDRRGVNGSADRRDRHRSGKTPRRIASSSGKPPSHRAPASSRRGSRRTTGCRPRAAYVTETPHFSGYPRQNVEQTGNVERCRKERRSRGLSRPNAPVWDAPSAAADPWDEIMRGRAAPSRAFRNIVGTATRRHDLDGPAFSPRTKIPSMSRHAIWARGRWSGPMTTTASRKATDAVLWV